MSWVTRISNRIREGEQLTKRNSFAKIGVVFVALLAALVLTSMGYGIWSDTLTVSGTVETGWFAAEFNQAVPNDPPGSLDPDVPGSWSLDAFGVPQWSGTTYEENTASTDVIGTGTDTLTITLSNAYPSYWSSVGVTIKNIGTIPMKVETVGISVFSEQDPGGANLNIIYTGALVEATHQQIEPAGQPGDEVLGDIHFHPVVPAPEGSNYTVTITVTVAQWNQ